MKKLFYSAIALTALFAVSCTKEVEAPVETAEKTIGFKTYSFEATLSDQTRTAYTDFQKFSWEAGDQIDVYTINEETEALQIATFTAQNDGVTTEFVGDVEDGYALGGMAVYPNNSGFINNRPVIYTPGAYFVDDTSGDYYSVPSNNPLETLALVGRANEDGTAYAFKTAMGAIKLSFTDLPAETRFLRISAPEKISGYFYIDENDCITNDSAVPGTYTYTDDEGTERTANYSNKNFWYHFTPASDGSATLYIALPVGKLSTGTTFYIENEDEDVLFQRSTSKDIVIERNKVTEIANLSTKVSWKSIGTGKFIDQYNWSIGGFADGTYVDVEIEADETNPYHYRLVNPYQAAITQFNYRVPRGTASPSPYFELNISADGHVDYPQVCTGIYYSQYKEATQLLSPKDAYGSDADQGVNFVAKYQADGKTPANILLAPSYYWPTSGYWTGNNYYYSTEEIQIIFPGATDAVDISNAATFVELADDSTEQPIALVNVTFGKDVSSAKLIIAKDKTAALADLEADHIGGTATSNGDDVEVLLPADAPSDNYYIYTIPVPVEGLAPVVSQLFESELPFQYVRTDAPDIEVADVIGTYTAASTYVLFNKPYWDAVNAGEEDPEENDDDLTWYGGYTVSFTLEESDDEGLGEVMMTSFTENAVDFCPIEYPIYAYLDHKSGAISFSPMQKIYSFTNESSGEEIEIQLANANGFKTLDLVFELSLDKTTYTSHQFFGYVYYFTQQDGFNYPDIWFSPTNVPLKLVKETSTPLAPAKMAASKPVKKIFSKATKALKDDFKSSVPFQASK